MIKQVLIASTFTAALAFNASTFAATIQSTGTGDSYVVTGIDDVVVDGVKYNVRFGDTWHDEVTYDKRFALNATKALVTLFTAGGQLQGTTADYYPATINGCSDLNWCAITTAFSYETTPTGRISLGAYRFINRAEADPKYPDKDYMLASSLYVSSLSPPIYTNATWVPSVSAVPVPAAALMFAPALLGFAALRRKKRA